MADLITAARTQVGYASKVLAGRFPKAQEHLDKADAFLARAKSAQSVTVADEHVAVTVTTADTDWSGTFDAAFDRFLDALIAKQTADGVEVAIKGSFSGHGYTRDENIAIAKSVGVLDELGGDDFFGPLVPGSTQ